jgi:putative addiction module component (TIGR02574 family)
MTATMEQVLKDALSLPSDSRLTLAERLMESVCAVPDPEVEARQITEICRRIEQIQSGQVELIPGELALQEVREALKRGK